MTPFKYIIILKYNNKGTNSENDSAWAFLTVWTPGLRISGLSALMMLSKMALWQCERSKLLSSLSRWR